MSRIKISLTILFSSLFTCVSALDYFFYIQFTDKNESPYSISNPQAYLSTRALERRAFFNIPINESDLPVNPTYVNQLKQLGLQIHCTTKWLNGATVLVSDSSVISEVRALPFVSFAQYTGINTNVSSASNVAKKAAQTDYDYGKGLTQINNMNGHVLHNAGFTGTGICIAVIDGGFNNADVISAFESLRTSGRLIGTRDFVNPASDIYRENEHGMYVLSTMAAKEDGVLIGTAPEASYLLIRSEAELGEYLCEPDFWISAIEYADSVGVDLATTSLGYTTFDDSQMNYTYSMLDGNTARASIAANIAYQKGIILLNAAGNEGNKSWKYISVPADATGVITVGAITKDSVSSTFSSYGPSYDGRVKPELCAIGTSSALLSVNGNTINGNGTSFATPILAGLTACYLQAFKHYKSSFSLDELRDNLYKSGHMYLTPTERQGYGVPNFEYLLSELKSTSLDSSHVSATNYAQKLIINNKKALNLNWDILRAGSKISLYDLQGKLLLSQTIDQEGEALKTIQVQDGIYILKITAP